MQPTGPWARVRLYLFLILVLLALVVLAVNFTQPSRVWVFHQLDTSTAVVLSSGIVLGFALGFFSTRRRRRRG